MNTYDKPARASWRDLEAVPFCTLTRESQAEIRAACEYWPED